MGKRRKQRRAGERRDQSGTGPEAGGVGLVDGAIITHPEVAAGAVVKIAGSPPGGDCVWINVDSETGNAAGSVGPVSGQNTVEIDVAALQREAAAVEVPQPEQSAAPGAGAAPNETGSAQSGEMSPDEAARRAAEMAPMLRQFIEGTARTLAPAWSITSEECGALAQSYALVAVYWWPDMQLPPKWAAVAAAAMVTFAVVDSRRDTDGNLLPRKIERAQRPATASGAAGQSSGAEPGGFTTAA